MGSRQPTSLDQARLRPHLRANQPQLIIAPDNGTRHVQTFKPHAVPTPGDLRGIPVVGQGVGGVQPGTQPEAATIARLTRAERAA